jgi:hypothetical protein
MIPNVSDARKWLLSWSSLGPLREIADIVDDMAATARAIGPEAAFALVDTLLALSREGSDLVDVMQEFLEIYGSLYPDALAGALLAGIGPAGPPALVEALEYPGRVDCVASLRERLDLAEASEELLITLASLLGALGGEAAHQLLLEIRGLPNASVPVEREVAVALETLR